MFTRWTNYSEYLKRRHGHSVYRIGVDGGFSCPNRRSDKTGGCAFCDGTGAVSVYQRTGEGGFRHDSEYNGIVAEGNTAYKGGMKEQIEKGKEFLKRRYKAEAYSLYFQSFTKPALQQ